MDYNTLLDMAVSLGYELAMSGAETFRVEESISRVLNAYGIDAEVFAIPNYLVVTILDEDGKPTRKPIPEEAFIDIAINHGLASPDTADKTYRKALGKIKK